LTNQTVIQLTKPIQALDVSYACPCKCHKDWCIACEKCNKAFHDLPFPTKHHVTERRNGKQ